MAKRLSREELIKLLDRLIKPNNLSSEEVNDEILLFSINCPDPARAMDLLIESGEERTPQQIVDLAFSMPRVDPNDLPATELHLSHPLRHTRLDD